MDKIKFDIIKKVAEVSFKIKALKDISMLNSNSPPSVFIGSKLKYPLVNVGIISPFERDENAWVYDDARYWADNNFKINDVLKIRSSLINSRFQSNVNDAAINNSNFIKIAQEIAVASKPVDVEIELKKKAGLFFGQKRDRILAPQGMQAGLKKARITGNISVDNKLDKVINDDIKASESVLYLYNNNFDEYSLSKILSVGVLGFRKSRRLVPTRWSITATDDILGLNLIKEINDFPWIENYELFFGEFMGNRYLILFFPGVWSYELFELYLPGSSWNPTNEVKASTDYEDNYGRKNYASATAGGYYASRLPVLEYLKRIKKQASVLAIRIETPGYWAALGVWVVRESVRKTIENRKLFFASLKEITDSSKKIGMIKFGFDPSAIFKKSKIIDCLKTQANLSNWL